MNKAFAAFGRFLLVGAVATGIQYAILFSLVHWAGMAPVPASAIGFCVSAVCNYYLNHRYTFASDRPHRSSAPRFAVTCAAGLVLNSIMLKLGLEVLGLNLLLAQILATAATLVWNFVANALWSFRYTGMKVRSRV